MALKVTRSQYPGICNSCARPVVYIITTGIHNLKLCRDCAVTLSVEICKQIEEDRDEIERVNYEHMQEVSHDKNIS